MTQPPPLPPPPAPPSPYRSPGIRVTFTVPQFPQHHARFELWEPVQCRPSDRRVQLPADGQNPATLLHVGKVVVHVAGVTGSFSATRERRGYIEEITSSSTGALSHHALRPLFDAWDEFKRTFTPAPPKRGRGQPSTIVDEVMRLRDAFRTLYQDILPDHPDISLPTTVHYLTYGSLATFTPTKASEPKPAALKSFEQRIRRLRWTWKDLRAMWIQETRDGLISFTTLGTETPYPSVFTKKNEPEGRATATEHALACTQTRND